MAAPHTTQRRKGSLVKHLQDTISARANHPAREAAMRMLTKAKSTSNRRLSQLQLGAAHCKAAALIFNETKCTDELDVAGLALLRVFLYSAMKEPHGLPLLHASLESGKGKSLRELYAYPLHMNASPKAPLLRCLESFMATNAVPNEERGFVVASAEDVMRAAEIVMNADEELNTAWSKEVEEVFPAELFTDDNQKKFLAYLTRVCVAGRKRAVLRAAEVKLCADAEELHLSEIFTQWYADIQRKIAEDVTTCVERFIAIKKKGDNPDDADRKMQCCIATALAFTVDVVPQWMWRLYALNHQQIDFFREGFLYAYWLAFSLLEVAAANQVQKGQSSPKTKTRKRQGPSKNKKQREQGPSKEKAQKTLHVPFLPLDRNEPALDFVFVPVTLHDPLPGDAVVSPVNKVLTGKRHSFQEMVDALQGIFVAHETNTKGNVKPGTLVFEGGAFLNGTPVLSAGAKRAKVFAADLKAVGLAPSVKKFQTPRAIEGMRSFFVVFPPDEAFAAKLAPPKGLKDVAHLEKVPGALADTEASAAVVVCRDTVMIGILYRVMGCPRCTDAAHDFLNVRRRFKPNGTKL